MGRTCFAVAQGGGGRDPSSTLSRSAHFAKLRCFLTGSALAGSKSPRLCNPGSANSSICRHHSHYMGRRARLRRELERVIRVGAAGLDAIRWHGRLRIGNRPKEMAVMQTPGRAAHVTVFQPPRGPGADTGYTLSFAEFVRRCGKVRFSLFVATPQRHKETLSLSLS